MKLLVVLSVLVAAAAAAEDQEAKDATFYSTLAHPYARTYTAGYPYTYSAYSAPAVYSSAYSAAPLAYSGLYGSALHGYAAPLVHSLKKRDTAAAEDQEADPSYVTYANHHPVTYTAGYPYTYSAYSAPAVYSSAYSAAPLAYSGLYGSAFHGYAAPLVHSLKKRDTEAAEEDQKPEEATFYSSVAAHPYSALTYAAHPYPAAVAYSSYALRTPASTVPVTYSTLPYAYGYHL